MQSHLSHIRTRKIWVGSLSLLGSTGVTIVVGIFMAGILARYFSTEEFGLWAILMSLNGILVNGFDLGFGNALRNRLAQLYSNPDLARKEGPGYFFSIFFWFILSAAILTGLFFALKPWVPWGLLFRSENSELVNQGASLLILGASILAFNIAFNLYTSGFFGYQETHWNALLNGFSKLSLLCFLAALVILQRSFFFINLMFFLLTLAASMVSFFIFLNRRKWPLQIPALASIWAKVKELWGKSAQFALLQIFSTLLLTSDYFVVSKVLGLEMVGEYFLVKRIYLVLASFHFALLLPIWSAYTESVESKDFVWVEKMVRKTVVYTIIIFSAGIGFMLLGGNWVVYLWTGKTIRSFSLFAWLGVWGLLYGWSNCFSVFLNGTGYLRRQVILVGFAAFAFIPSSLYWGGKYGIAGVCLALILVHIPVAISNPIESMGILNEFKGRRVRPNVVK